MALGKNAFCTSDECFSAAHKHVENTHSVFSPFSYAWLLRKKKEEERRRKKMNKIKIFKFGFFKLVKG